MLPPILTEKMDKLHFPGLYLTLFLVSAILFVDCFSLQFWGETVTGIFAKPDTYKSIILLIFYLIGIYLVMLFKLVVAATTSARWLKIENVEERINSEDTYYTAQRLLNDAVKEDNKVKYQIYERVEANEKQVENIKTMSYATVLLIIWDFFLSRSVMRIASEHFIFWVVLSLSLIVGSIAFFSLRYKKALIFPLINRMHDAPAKKRYKTG
jgi:hypothetical protein